MRSQNSRRRGPAAVRLDSGGPGPLAAMVGMSGPSQGETACWRASGSGFFDADEAPPACGSGLWPDGRRRLEMLVDRCHSRRKIPSAFRSVYCLGDLIKVKTKNSYLKGNINALKYELRKYKVDTQDIEDLEEAIQRDELDENSAEFGPAVNSWIHNMLQKAREAAWQIELSMASAVLTDALNHYYGLWK